MNPKQWISVDDQLNLLKSRGLHISDEPNAKEYLKRIGYYRLSGYFYSMRQISGEISLLENGRKPIGEVKTRCIVLDEFKPNACFQDAVELYIFDKKLRLLVLDALERIEIAIRVDIAYLLGQSDKYAYLNPSMLHTSFCSDLNKTNKGVSQYHEWLSKHAQLINRSKEEFIKHNKATYGLPLPIWVACEVWDFGCMSTLFSGMKKNDQDSISQKYNINDGQIFASWLRSLNYLRNVCAHHARLWNRNIIDQPKMPSATPQISWVSIFDEKHKSRCFLLLCLCRHLLETINPSSSWSQRTKEHLKNFPDLGHIGLDLYGMGAPQNWENIWA